MAHSFRKFISEVFVNGKFPKISRYTVCVYIRMFVCLFVCVAYDKPCFLMAKYKVHRLLTWYASMAGNSHNNHIQPLSW